MTLGSSRRQQLDWTSSPSLPAYSDRGQASPALDGSEIIDEVLRRVSEESSTWLLADLARHVATLLPANTTGSASELVERIDQLAEQAKRHCYDLTPHVTRDGACRQDGRPVLEHITDHRLSTTAILKQERDLQRWARTATDQPAPNAGDPAANAATAMAGTAELVVIVGPAGTGKTTATAEAVAELHTAGRPVIGLAPSGKAADVLGTEARCPTETMAGFLTRHTNSTAALAVGTTVILDEAGMASTDDLAHLVDLVRQNRWRLVAVGDPNQLPAVGRGGVLAHWCNTIPHIELTAPRRFQNPWEAHASLDLRTGKPDAATTSDRNGRLHGVHPALLPRQVAALHQQQTAAGRTVASPPAALPPPEPSTRPSNNTTTRTTMAPGSLWPTGPASALAIRSPLDATTRAWPAQKVTGSATATPGPSATSTATAR